ncbi:hypothetical protein SAMN06295937_10511, partial [Sphingopyxis flava]
MKNWTEYLELLAPVDEILKETPTPVDEQLRADLYRQISMNLSQAYFLLMSTDPRYPEFVPYLNSGFLLQPNPDAVYYVASLDGKGTCRVTGERGNAPVLGFATGNKMFGTDGLKMGKGFGNCRRRPRRNWSSGSGHSRCASSPRTPAGRRRTR